MVAGIKSLTLKRQPKFDKNKSQNNSYRRKESRSTENGTQHGKVMQWERSNLFYSSSVRSISDLPPLSALSSGACQSWSPVSFTKHGYQEMVVPQG